MQVEKIILNKERDVNLTAYIQDVGKEFSYIKERPAILILPGGGYQFCSDREADPVALPYLEAGYQAFILRYSVAKNSTWPNPLNDYEEAIELIKNNKDKWHVSENHIAVIGFSAGGHLAACAATMAKNRPSAAILGYPVIKGDFAKACNKTAPDVIEAIDDKTCPCFVFATRTDNIVPIENSIQFIDALEKKEIAFECHIYGNGKHGFSVCNSSVQIDPSEFSNRVPNWVNDSIEWLKDVMGDFGNNKINEPRFSRITNGNKEEYLNIDCTIGYLYSKPEAMEILKPLMEKANENQSEVIKQNQDNLADDAKQEMAKMMKLSDALTYTAAPKEMIEMLDKKLRQIPNK